MATNIVLVGGPNSGKSNYIARLWVSLSKNEGRLFAPTTPDKIEYVEKLVEHLFSGKFAPRSDSSLHEEGNDLVVDVAIRDANPAVSAALVVPDVLGEVWKNAVANSHLAQRWHDLVSTTTSALLFVHANSPDNFDALNWVTAGELLALGMGDSEAAGEIPTQVAMCELLRMLEDLLSKSERKPRVAVIVAAWDKLDPRERKSAPIQYLDKEFPLFAGRLRDALAIDVRVFGLSVVGGDLSEESFRQQLLETGVLGNGYVVFEHAGVVEESKDVTLPLQWLLGQ
ncbi:hypothetical protein P3T43_000630 [Paraburkholderia sp. GAS41]|uniref:TRAFAC clade GTPase domain-containing protein n=1 Tax=Paraburkholderia sp. GAS41 TaxID=3035134 RepID=UPI003D23110F